MALKQKTLRIFIVEDYHLVLLGLCSDLDNHQHISIVGTAGDAETALPQIKELKPDLVVMDLGLPGMSGIEATQEIKAFNSDIKVLILTSHEQREEVIAAFSAGANGYCIKESTPYGIVDSIQAVSNGVSWIDGNISSTILTLFQDAETKPLPKTDDYAMPISPLTTREIEVLELLVEGKNNTQISTETHLSVHTVKTHVSSIFKKLTVNDRVKAAVKAVRTGIIKSG